MMTNNKFYSFNQKCITERNNGVEVMPNYLCSLKEEKKNKNKAYIAVLSFLL